MLLSSEPAVNPEGLSAAHVRYSATARTARWHPATVRAALWTWCAVVRARRELRRSGLRAAVAPPPRLPVGARRGVEAVLRRLDPTCLERSLVLQAWMASCGVLCQVVIGVTREAGDVKAHAWLDVEAGDPLTVPYAEIHRLPPPTAALP